jgi:hypothetical protein
MFRKMEGEKKSSIKSEILAARSTKGWNEYIKCGYKFA